MRTKILSSTIHQIQKSRVWIVGVAIVVLATVAAANAQARTTHDADLGFSFLTSKQSTATKPPFKECWIVADGHCKYDCDKGDECPCLEWPSCGAAEGN